MLTRTMGMPLSVQHIYCSAVDPGWCSRMRPGVGSIKSTPPPLTPEDGAARVLDPVFTALVAPDSAPLGGTEPPYFGVLLRHFAVDSQW